MATEKLKFRLELYATMWDRPPHVEILINDQSMFKKDITGSLDKPDLLEFEYEMAEGQEYSLIINRSGKQGKAELTNTKNDHGIVWPEQIESQTVADEDGKIIKDQVLHIKSIEIDEINIGGLVYDGVYTPRYPEPWAADNVSLVQNFPNFSRTSHSWDTKVSGNSHSHHRSTCGF